MHDQMGLQHLEQGLGGVKEVKVLGGEDVSVSEYRVHAVGSARANRHQVTLLGLPRLWLELLAVAGLAALVAVMIGQGQVLGTILPTVGLFAAAAFRFMPSVNRVLNAVQSLRYCVPVIEALDHEVRLIGDSEDSRPHAALPFNRALVLDRVSFQYESGEAPVLRDVSLSVDRGSSVGFVGRSGAGKSTLVDVVLGLLAPDRGTVSVDGIDIQTNLRGWQEQIGYVPQSIFLTDDTLRRNVAFGLPDARIDESAVWRAIRPPSLKSSWKSCREGSTVWSVSAVSASPVVNVSESVSLAPFTETPQSSCWTRRRARSTRLSNEASWTGYARCVVTRRSSSSLTERALSSIAIVSFGWNREDSWKDGRQGRLLSVADSETKCNTSGSHQRGDLRYSTMALAS